MNHQYVDYQKAIANVNNAAKPVDGFSVEFYGIPENEGNLLGRYIKSISRPNIEFMSSQFRYRDSTFKDKENVNLSPVTATFVDDHNGIVTAILYNQVARQMNKTADRNGNIKFASPDDREYKFGVRYKILNLNREVVEEYEITNCFINALEHSVPMHGDTGKGEVILTLEYDNMTVYHADRFAAFLRGITP